MGEYYCNCHDQGVAWGSDPHDEHEEHYHNMQARQRYKCKQCPAIFYAMSDLGIHVETVHQEEKSIMRQSWKHSDPQAFVFCRNKQLRFKFKNGWEVSIVGHELSGAQDFEYVEVMVWDEQGIQQTSCFGKRLPTLMDANELITFMGYVKAQE